MPAPLLEVVREWGRIGVIGFGGPPAHIALLREVCVDRRRWLSAREFEDANAACQLLPGPASTQMAIFCAHRVAGVRGALAGGLAFILPGLAIILALAAASLASAPPDWIRGVGAGAGAAVVAVVAQAGIALGRSSLGGLTGARRMRAVAYLVAGALAAVFLGLGLLVVLLACGLLEFAIRRRPSPPVLRVHAWPVVAAVGATGAAAIPALCWMALKVGALSFGGGYVIIPLMHDDAVDVHGWMTDAEFLNAVAFGQVTPGPVTHTVAVVGWAAAGLGGALLASVVAFAPSFLFVLLGEGSFQRLRRSPAARAFLDGAGPAAVGAILGAAVPLLDGVRETWQWAILAAAALAILVLRAGSLPVLLGAAALGAAAALSGADLP